MPRKRHKDDPDILGHIERNVTINANGCWIWNLAKNVEGYGEISVDNKKWSVHRLMYSLLRGDVEGIYVLHSCDTPSCCNPEHLFSGTHDSNSQDMVEKNRASRLIGETNPSVKLTESQVVEIIRRLSNGESQKDLASEYKVTKVCIHAIKHNKTWQHLPRPEPTVIFW